jgi:hypothetical protein
MDQALLNELVAEARQLIIEKAPEAEEAAKEANDKNPEAQAKGKLSLALEWEIENDAPKTKVTASFSTQVKKVVEGQVYIRQAEMSFGNDISGVEVSFPQGGAK